MTNCNSWYRIEYLLGLGGLGGGADSLDGALGDFTPPGSSGPLGGGSSGGGNVA